MENLSTSTWPGLATYIGYRRARFFGGWAWWGGCAWCPTCSWWSPARTIGSTAFWYPAGIVRPFGASHGFTCWTSPRSSCARPWCPTDLGSKEHWSSDLATCSRGIQVGRQEGWLHAYTTCADPLSNRCLYPIHRSCSRPFEVPTCLWGKGVDI